MTCTLVVDLHNGSVIMSAPLTREQDDLATAIDESIADEPTLTVPRPEGGLFVIPMGSIACVAIVPSAAG